MPSRVLALMALLFAPLAESAVAAPRDPFAFTPLGVLNTTRSVTVDTGANPPILTFGATTFNGVVDNEAAVFTFSSVRLGHGSQVQVVGSRALAILSQGDFTIHGVVGAVADGQFGVAGGANGSATGTGFGPGGGPSHSGAGHGGVDGSGGFSFIPGGPVYGDIFVLLEGGSGGGVGFAAGGGGGGAIEIGAARRMTIGRTAVVGSLGGNGGDGAGGGSGGSVLIHGEIGSCAAGGRLRAIGGAGGFTEGQVPERGGGGGAGGRIGIVGIDTSACSIELYGGPGEMGTGGQGENGGDGVLQTL